jgi:hypothetical protein
MNDDVVVPSSGKVVYIGAETTLALAICGLHIRTASSDDIVEVVIAEVRRCRREDP